MPITIGAWSILNIICLYTFVYLIPANGIVVLVAYVLGSVFVYTQLSEIYLYRSLSHNILHAGGVGSRECMQMHRLFRCLLISNEICAIVSWAVFL